MNQNSPSKKPVISRGKLAITILVIGGFSILMFTLFADPAGQTLGASMLALIPAAFISGLLSFLSPCSLPILPAYFAYTFQSSKKNIVLTTVAFFLGLATTMTLLGASVTALGSVLVRNISALSIIGGTIIIVFGLLSIFGKGFSGIQFQEMPTKTLGGSYIYGATFAVGWSACIGPILGAILTLLATQGAGILQGALLSFIYTLGLGLPLIIISALFSRLGNRSRFWKVIRGRGINVKIFKQTVSIHSTGLVSGLLLIGMGILLMTGTLNQLTQLGLESNISAWVIELDEKIRLMFGLR